MKTPIERKLFSYLSLIMLVLLILGALVYQGVLSMRATGNLVNQTLRVQQEIEELSARISQAGEVAREYYLTEDARLLDQYVQLKRQSFEQIDKIKNLTVEKGDQQQKLNDIRAPLERNFGLLDLMIEARRRMEFDVIIQLLRGPQQSQLRGELARIISEMEREEERLYRDRVSKRTQQSVVAAATGVIGVLAAASLLMLTGFSLRREISKQTEGERRLRESEEIKALLLTREQEARTQAEAASRTKDEFLAIVSHELRSPLNAMLGWARVLRSGGVDQSTHDHAIQVIEQSAEMQSRLIEDLLDSARIASGKLRIEERPVDLIPVFKSALETVLPGAESKKVKITIDLDTQAGLVTGDAERLQQIIWNLLSNAVKFTPAGGVVEVRVQRQDPWMTIAVSDTGRGIKAADLPFIFDQFRQADSSNTRRAGGLGLGLALVQSLVELHGGSIKAESKGEGRGATFTVNLPLRAVGGGAVEQLSSTRGPTEAVSFQPVLTGLNVLTVDDEEQARDLIALLLKKYGASVTSVSSSAEAMAELTNDNASRKFDLLVSDIGMPDENGYTLIRRVRKLPPPLNRIPAVALTAFGRAEDRIQALEAGFQTHIPKPVEPAELMMVIASLTGRKS